MEGTEGTHDRTLLQLRLPRESTDDDPVAVIERDGIHDAVHQTDPLHKRVPLPRTDSRDLAGRSLQAYDVASADLGEFFGSIGRRVGGADVFFELDFVRGQREKTVSA